MEALRNDVAVDNKYFLGSMTLLILLSEHQYFCIIYTSIEKIQYQRLAGPSQIPIDMSKPPSLTVVTLPISDPLGANAQTAHPRIHTDLERIYLDNPQRQKGSIEHRPVDAVPPGYQLMRADLVVEHLLESKQIRAS